MAEDNQHFISGSFVLNDIEADELGAPTRSTMTRDTVTEREIGQTYYGIRLVRAQYGTYKSNPACLLVFDASFHSTNSKNYRFKSASITVNFGIKENDNPAEVYKFAPHRFYGVPREESSKWHWEVGASTSLNLPPANIELLNAKIGQEKEYPIMHMLKFQGTSRGSPYHSRVVWSVEERKQDGIPLRLPPLSVIVACEPGRILWADVEIEVHTGWSLSPMVWPLMSPPNKPLRLHPDFPKGTPLEEKGLELVDLAKGLLEWQSRNDNTWES